MFDSLNDEIRASKQWSISDQLMQLGGAGCPLCCAGPAHYYEKAA
jgi:hypothetical protein